MKRVIAALTVLFILASSAVPCLALRGAAPLDAVGMSLMGLSAADIFGNAVDDTIFSRSACTVVNYWATWCIPCLAEMPDFVTMNNYYLSTPENDVQLYGVLYYIEPGEIAEARDIVTEQGFDWPHIVCNQQLESVAATYDPQGIFVPQTLIVDRSGVIRAHWGGRFANYAELRAFVSGWLEILSAEEPGQMPGDADGDGSVSVGDALWIMRRAMGLIGEIPCPENCDLDANGSINIADAVLTLRMVMGLRKGMNEAHRA